jgi:Holliday junction DNA helicase RuvA
MITKITGKLIALDDDAATLSIPPMEYEVLIAEFTRRHLQSQLSKDIVLHTIHYMDGNVTSGGRLTPRLVGFLSTAEREFFELFCSVDGVGVKKALRAMTQPVQGTLGTTGYWTSYSGTHHRQAAEEDAQVCLAGTSRNSCGW